MSKISFDVSPIVLHWTTLFLPTEPEVLDSHFCEPGCFCLFFIENICMKINFFSLLMKLSKNQQFAIILILELEAYLRAVSNIYGRAFLCKIIKRI